MTMSLLIRSLETSFIPKIVHSPNPKPSKLHNLKPLAKDKPIGLKVSCNVKDYDELLGLDQNLSSQGSKEEEEKQKYYVNLGYAIRSLREDFPSLFNKELSFDIYRFISLSFFTFLNLIILFYYLHTCYIFFGTLGSMTICKIQFLVLFQG